MKPTHAQLLKSTPGSRKAHTSRVMAPAVRLKRRGDVRRALRRLGRLIVHGEPPIFSTPQALAWWEAMSQAERLGALIDSGCHTGDAIYRWHQRAARLAEGMGPA